MIKVLSVVMLSLVGANALACLSSGGSSICSGDLVYKGTEYSQGATVIATNAYEQSVSVRSNSTGNIFKESVSNLSPARGCVNPICVGGLVYKGNEYSQGARVVAVNPRASSVVVRSNATGNLFVEWAQSLEISRGCIGHICTGELIYKGTEYSQGARIESVNPSSGMATVRSVHTGNLFQEMISNLSLASGCAGHICAGQTVYKGSEYSQGATVVAVHDASQTVVVRSNMTGNLFTEHIHQLDSVSQIRQPIYSPPRRAIDPPTVYYPPQVSHPRPVPPPPVSSGRIRPPRR